MTAAALVGLASSTPTPALAGTRPNHARGEMSASADTQAQYARGGYRPRALPATAWPYRDIPPAPRVDPEPHDAAGVRMFIWRGSVHDHPVVQAQWGLSNLRTYLDNRDPFFLNRAIAQAQRNLDRRNVSRDAWWYPYGFTFPRCAGVPIVNAP